MAKLSTNKPILILLYGLPGSGKTNFSRQLTENINIAHINSDRIRGELFDKPRFDKEENDVITHLMDYMAEQFLNAGVSVIYDVNAMRFSQRRILRDMARKSHAQSVLVWLQIDVESAFARIAGRDRRRSDDKFAMPLDRTTFDSLIANMQNPNREEDYVVISGKHTFKTQLSSVIKRLRDIGLLSPVDTSQRLARPELVNLIPNANVGRVDMTRRNIVIR